MLSDMTTSASPCAADSVAVLANKAIRPGTVVLDIGAGDGAWTRAMLAAVPEVEVHCFESDRAAYRQLLLQLAPFIAVGQVIPHNSAAGWIPDDGTAVWSSLPQYAAWAGLKRLPFVRLGSRTPLSAVTAGCEDLIRHGHIEFILVTADAQQEKALAEALLPHRYELFRHPALGDQVLCSSDRFRSTIKNQQPRLPDVLELCQEFGITPKGIIHAGAHDGQQATRYVDAGIAKSLLIEANPSVYARLEMNVTGLNGVTAIHCAASDQNAMAELRVASSDQSSSVFPFARYQAIHPSVRQTSLTEVPAKTLDQILQDTGQDAGEFNLLHLEIQGGELLALKGAAGLLPNVQAILTELNYEELYTGGATVEQMDAFLEARGFDRVATTTPIHASWGSAFYVRRKPDQSQQISRANDFLCNARNALVNGWLSIPPASLREAWEGATGYAHRHLVDNGILTLPITGDDDLRVVDLLEKSLKSAPKDRKLQIMLALMLYVPVEQIDASTEGMPGWLRKSLPGLKTAA
jgi:FkbM family methyltransferase